MTIMTSHHFLHRPRVRAVLAGLMLTLAACTVDKAAPPPLAGPSEFGLSLAISATPDQLPRDGSSQSIVTVMARNAANQPAGGQLLRLAASIGTLTASQVVTGSDGRATFAFTAPFPQEIDPGNGALILVTPTTNSGDDPAPRLLRIALTGASNGTAPEAAFTFTPTDPEPFLNVVFDATTTKDEGGLCGDNCTYEWDFGGEATKTGRVVNYQFREVRVYAVRLTVSDAFGARVNLTQNVTVKIGSGLIADFTVSPANVAINEDFFFDPEVSDGAPGFGSKYPIVKYTWNFGDSTSLVETTGRIVTKRYSVANTYVVVLTVEDSQGRHAVTSKPVTVAAPGAAPGAAAPIAVITVSPTSPKAGAAVFFDGSGSRAGVGLTITDYAWIFGDGTTGTGASPPSHPYATAGTYVIRLTVTDSLGRTGTTTATVTVVP